MAATQWEYLVFGTATYDFLTIQQKLNELGQEGYEVVLLLRENLLLLKHPKP